MVKAAKSYQQKYEKIMGESSEDELWSDIERDIAEFKRKSNLEKQTDTSGICILICCAAIDLCLQE